MNEITKPLTEADQIEHYSVGQGAYIPDEAVFADGVGASGNFDLRVIWNTIYRHRYMMMGIIALSIVGGVVSILVMPKIYQARASVQIDQQAAKVLGTEETEPLVTGQDADRFLQTQVDVLSSRAMAKRVSDTLGLAANDDFLKAMSGQAQIDDSIGTGSASRSELVLDSLQKNLSVDLRRDSRVVGVMFQSRDPELAAKIANTYYKDFIEGNIQRKFSTSAYSREFLENQLTIAKRRLEASERALIDYARSAKLIDASGAAKQPGEADPPQSLITANLVQLNADYATSQANLVQAQQRWEQAQKTPLMSLPDVLTNNAIQDLTQRKVEQTAQLNQLRQRLKSDHPTVIQAVAQLSSLEQQIQALATSIRDSIKNQYLTAQRQNEALAQQVNTLKSATLAEQSRSVQYNILKREVDTNRQLFESLLQRYKEVSAESGITSNNISVVDTAEVPRKPISPRALLNMALALLTGIGLSLLYAFVREHVDDAIRDPRDVETKLHLPLLGVVPVQEDGNPLKALDDVKSELAEAYHSIRSAIELSSSRGLPASLLVTSSSKSEGKSTTSYALARGFAQLGRRVLLVDADFRRPSLHRLFGIPLPDMGLSTVLARASTFDDAVLETPFANLMFMPSGPIPPDPTSLFAGGGLAELLASLKSRYDLVLIDGPPVLALADAALLTVAIEATVFVAEAGGAHYGQARNAVSRLWRARGNMLGCIVTKYNMKKAGYGYSYGYYSYSYS